MADRVSALAGHYTPGRYGEPGDPGVHLGEVRDLVLHQIAAWPETVDAVADLAAQAAAADAAPGPCSAAAGAKGTLLRVEPLKWWLHGTAAPQLDAEQGVILDLSHARTQLRVAGKQAQLCLNRLLPVDLRAQACPTGTVVSTALHHVGVTLWRSAAGFELFVPRGFALSVWEVLFDTAVQFGVEIEQVDASTTA